jgi:gliding motility-associated-like protein
MKKLYTLAALLFLFSVSHAQISKGKDFWFGFLQNYYAQTGELRVYITSETPCSGIISSPLQNWSQTFTVTPGISTLVVVPQNIGENVNSDLITTQALHVVTSECVSVFAHYYQQFTSDAAVIFPTNSLGRDYVVTSWYNASMNNGNPEFLIAATEDNTTIDITPSTAAGAHSAGVTYSISIDSGQVYQLQSTNGDLTGTKVVGTNNKNFALFGGHVCANVVGCGYCDHLFDQLYPTPSWGNDFVTVPYATRDYDVFRVLASQNGTQFRINGGAPINLNAGQFNEFQLSAVGYITSNLPISVMQYSTGTDCDANQDDIGDPFMIALSPVTQNINSVTYNAFANANASFTYYTNIIAKTADLNTVTFDGVGIGGTFAPVPQNPTYSFVQRTITQGDHTVSSNQGIIAYVYGYGPYESYGYSAGVRVQVPILSVYDTSKAYCPFDTVNLSLNTADTARLVSLEWDLGDGSPRVRDSLHFFHIYNNYGEYPISIIYELQSACKKDTLVIDTVKILGPEPHLGGPYQFCVPTNVALHVTTRIIPDTLFWTVGGNTIITTDPNYVLNLFADKDTVVYVRISSNICDGFDTARIYVGSDTAGFTVNNACSGTPVSFTNTSKYAVGLAYSWLWDFGDGTTSTLQSPSHLFAAGGTYQVKLVLTSPAGCSDSITRPVTIYSKPVIDITTPRVCNDSVFTPVNNTTISSGTMTFQWNFGDGTPIDTAQYPSHIYAQSGGYNITLVALAGGGACKDSFTNPTNIIIGAVQEFSGVNVCLGQTTQFNDLTVNNSGSAILSYTWDFGDGVGTSNQLSPAYTYTTDGSYQVTLVLDYGSNCYDSVTHTVSVNPAPVADFTAPDLCNTGTSSPTDATTINTGTYTLSWNFGDNTASVPGTTPTHTYAQSGNYNIQLIANSASGCSDTITKPIIVIRGTTINFSAPAVCEGAASVFTDQTTNPYNTTINGYSWDFNDGNTAATQNTTHTYAAFGTYNVELRLDYGNNCADSLTKAVIVNENPVAAFTVADVCNDSVARPVNTSSISAGALNYNWTFGDGSAAVTTQTPTHTYQQSNTYNIQLITSSAAGCADTTTNPVRMIIGTRINFSAPAVCEGAASVFTDQTTNPYNTTINGYSWDFNDGNTAATQNTTHTYAAFGTYNVELRLDYGNNCADSLTKAVIVNENPVAAFTVADVCNDSVARPVNTSSISAGALNYSWTFGDGSAAVTTQTPTHTYQQSNTYNIQLITSSAAGCADTTTNPVRMIIGTRINFSAPAVCEGAASVFTDQTTNPYNTTINGYSWDFNDGNTAATQNTTHTYAAFGTYNVELRLDYGNNCADSLTKAVIVNENPVAAFTVADVCNDSVVNPVNTSSISSGALNYAWSFGDGTAPVIGQTPAHTYQQTNSYTIGLIVAAATGCADTTSNPVNVIVGTFIDFTTADLCEGATSVFTDQTANPYNTTITGYSWTFGDGNTASTQNTTHIYAAAGNYNVQLRLDYGPTCFGTLTKPVSVKQNPVADFNANTPCIGNATQVTDASTPAGTLNAWAWDLGDGTTVNTQNGSHIYALAGNYNAQLIVTSTDGCKDTVQKQVTVLGISQAQFTAAPVCYPNPTQFVNTTDETTYPVSNYSWTFGDASGTSNQSNPSYAYGANGTYTAIVIANYANGCADTGSAQVVVYEIPSVSSSITDASCFGGNDGVIQLTPVAGQQPFAYNWASGQSTATISGLTKGQYDVVFTDAHTCTATGTYQVNEPTQLLIDTATTPITCFAYTDGTITVTASAGTPGYFYSWSNGASSSVVGSLGSGSYSVTCSDSKGCSVSTSFTLADPPLYAVVADTVATVDLGETVTLTADALNGNPVSWNWSPSNFLTCATCQTTDANLYYNYVYTVETVDDKGCKASATVRVTVTPKYDVFIPNAFTPNGDGANDFFEVYGNKQAWKQFEVNVFDRIGEKVFESNDMNFKWDGTYKGRLMNPTVLVYVIKVVYLDNFTDKVYKGSLTLLR